MSCATGSRSSAATARSRTSASCRGCTATASCTNHGRARTTCSSRRYCATWAASSSWASSPTVWIRSSHAPRVLPPRSSARQRRRPGPKRSTRSRTRSSRRCTSAVCSTGGSSPSSPRRCSPPAPVPKRRPPARSSRSRAWIPSTGRPLTRTARTASTRRSPARPTPRLVTMWREPARNLPVVGAPDVLVVGAGSAGIAAAVASARRGAKTWLVERYGFVGGLATFGLVNLLLTLDDGEGTQVVGGLCQELVDRLDARGAARFPPSAEWGREDPEAVERWRRSGLIWGAPPDVVRYSVAFDPEELVTVAYEMLAEAGVHLRLHSWCVAAPTHDGAIDAVVLESKAGRQVVRPRVVIDATGDGDVLVAAGATHERVPVHPYLWFRMGGVDDDAADAAQLGLAFRTTTPGRSLIAWGGPGVVSRKYDLCDPDELTAAELECRTSALAEAGRLRAEAPGFADAWVDDVAKLLGITESRRLVGDFVLEKDHGDLRFPDAVARTGHWTCLLYTSPSPR